jgi:hypothetical protein
MKRTQSRFLGVLVGVAAAVVSCATSACTAHAQPLQNAAGAYELEVLVDGRSAPRFFHAGESYVMGRMGQRYTLRIWNRSGRRIEAVVAVDGRDVVDGKPGDFRNKRGYLVPAWGSVDIDGWRLSEREAAAFRFTTVPNSYAGRMGNARNVGVIGVAVFPERVYRPRPQPVYPRYPQYPYPADEEYRSEAAPGRGAGSAAPPAASAKKPSTPAPSAAPSAEASGEGAIADSSASRSRAERSPHRPGLGTEFGESVDSHIQEVFFARASASTPAVMLGVRYNDRAGLLAMGVDVDGYYSRNVADDTYLRGTADPFPVSHRRYAPPPAGWRR